MEDDIFEAALAGLLHNLSSFAQRAGESSLSWAEIVPHQWLDVVQGDKLAPVVDLAARLVVGTQPNMASQPSGQLATIFCSLTLAGEAGVSIEPPPKAYLPLKELKVQRDTIFPNGTATHQGNNLTPEYRNLWYGSKDSRGFKAEAMALKQAHEKTGSIKEAYLNSLLKLLERYCWSIPVGHADISLYDQSRMTAALAACLVNRDDADITKRGVALLVGGDISGVQDFIYTITSRGATSALRGRSMYLQLLTDIVTRYLLTEMGLPLTNIIYAGGGHFYLLAPISAETTIGEAQKKISRILLHHHQGDLYLAVAQQPLYINQFQGEELAGSWKGLTQALQIRKQRRFSELGAEMADLLFKPLEHGGNEEKLCSVCGREHQGTKVTDEERQIRKCPVCIGYEEELGDGLRKARYLLLDEVEQSSLPGEKDPAGNYEIVLKHFGYQIELCKNPPEADPTKPYRETLALKDEALDELQPTPNQAVGRRFLVNVTPTLKPDEYDDLKDKIDDLPKKYNPKDPPVKPFEAMAYQSKGIKRLGVLRMDVDNLGRIFSTGLGEKANLARIATLSFSMSLFFEGWVEHIAETLNAKQDEDLIYSIYSGGDDLFFVGAWHLLPRLAEEISKDLKEYAAHHEGIHLSGGIALIPSKYPLYQAAEDAAKAEDTAKSNPGKNALNFLDKTIPWVKFAQVAKQQQDLADLVNSNKAPKALLQRLNQLYAEYAQTNRKLAEQGQSEKVYWGPWHWHSAYSLARMAEQNKQAKAEIHAIWQQLSQENFKNIERVGLASRWAELFVRKGN